VARIVAETGITRDKFHRALKIVLSQQHFEALGADPERSKAAVYELWMKEIDAPQEAEIIRKYRTELDEYGSVTFAEPEIMKSISDEERRYAIEKAVEHIRVVHRLGLDEESEFYMDAVDGCLRRGQPGKALDHLYCLIEEFILPDEVAERMETIKTYI